MVIRLAILAGVVVVVHFGFVVLRAGTQQAEVLPPARSLETLPLTLGLGDWHGTEGHMDPALFAGTESREAVDRAYTNRAGTTTAAVFVAFYDKPERGAYHNPISCYRENGWINLEEHREPLRTTERADMDVSISTWESRGKKVLVLYWYEMGDDILYDRESWVGVRWSLRGRTTWPPMFKVLIQIPFENVASESVASRSAIELASYVREWLGTLTPAAKAPAPSP
jgi:hypothetical protein